MSCCNGTDLSSLQDKGGEGVKELEELHSDRMKVVQLDVCSEEQVNQAVEYINNNLEDPERGELDKSRSACSHSGILIFCDLLSLLTLQVCGLW